MRARKGKGSQVAAPTYKVTKIIAAEENLIAAVRLFFGGSPPVPVLVLANSAREIVAALGDKLGMETVQAELAAKFGKTIPEIVAPISKAAGFLKHADRQHDAHIELNERDVEIALYLACLDFGVVAGGLPVEAQVYEGWILAKGVEKVSAMPLRGQRMIRNLIRHFPGIRSADISAQKRLGLDALKTAERDETLRMNIKRDVGQITASETGS